MPRALVQATIAVSFALALPAASAAAPCAPGAALTPTIIASDPLDTRADRTLTATHEVVLSAEWPTGGAAFADDLTASWIGPSGVPVFNQRSRGARELEIGSPGSVGFLPSAAGPFPVTVTWDQTDNAGAKCTGTFSTTLQIAPARRVRPPIPGSGRGVRNSSSFSWPITIGRNGNRSPLQVRFRAVRGAHLPGPRVAFKSATFVQRPTDPGTARAKVLNAGIARLRAEPTAGGPSDDGVLLTFGVLPRSTNPSFGYEIQILQGTRRIGRLRVAARCDAFFCTASTYKLER